MVAIPVCCNKATFETIQVCSEHKPTYVELKEEVKKLSNSAQFRRVEMQQKEIKELRSALEVATEALKPFADEAKRIVHHQTSGEPILSFTFAQCYKAKEALSHPTISKQAKIRGAMEEVVEIAEKSIPLVGLELKKAFDKLEEAKNL